MVTSGPAYASFLVGKQRRQTLSNGLASLFFCCTTHFLSGTRKGAVELVGVHRGCLIVLAVVVAIVVVPLLAKGGQFEGRTAGAMSGVLRAEPVFEPLV